MVFADLLKGCGLERLDVVKHVLPVLALQALARHQLKQGAVVQPHAVARAANAPLGVQLAKQAPRGCVVGPQLQRGFGKVFQLKARCTGFGLGDVGGVSGLCSRLQFPKRPVVMAV